MIVKGEHSSLCFVKGCVATMERILLYHQLRMTRCLYSIITK